MQRRQAEERREASRTIEYPGGAVRDKKSTAGADRRPAQTGGVSERDKEVHRGVSRDEVAPQRCRTPRQPTDIPQQNNEPLARRRAQLHRGDSFAAVLLTALCDPRRWKHHFFLRSLRSMLFRNCGVKSHSSLCDGSVAVPISFSRGS